MIMMMKYIHSIPDYGVYLRFGLCSLYFRTRTDSAPKQNKDENVDDHGGKWGLGAFNRHMRDRGDVDVDALWWAKCSTCCK